MSVLQRCKWRHAASALSTRTSSRAIVKNDDAAELAAFFCAAEGVECVSTEYVHSWADEVSPAENKESLERWTAHVSNKVHPQAVSAAPWYSATDTVARPIGYIFRRMADHDGNFMNADETLQNGYDSSSSSDGEEQTVIPRNDSATSFRASKRLPPLARLGQELCSAQAVSVVARNHTLRL